MTSKLNPFHTSLTYPLGFKTVLHVFRFGITTTNDEYELNAAAP
jgi:hypothetical protein